MFRAEAHAAVAVTVIYTAVEAHLRPPVAVVKCVALSNLRCWKDDVTNAEGFCLSAASRCRRSG